LGLKEVELTSFLIMVLLVKWKPKSKELSGKSKYPKNLGFLKKPKKNNSQSNQDPSWE